MISNNKLVFSINMTEVTQETVDELARAITPAINSFISNQSGTELKIKQGGRLEITRESSYSGDNDIPEFLQNDGGDRVPLYVITIMPSIKGELKHFARIEYYGTYNILSEVTEEPVDPELFIIELSEMIDDPSVVKTVLSDLKVMDLGEELSSDSALKAIIKLLEI